MQLLCSASLLGGRFGAATDAALTRLTQESATPETVDVFDAADADLQEPFLLVWKSD